MRLKPLKVDEIDAFLSRLAEEFEVPKPNYCIYKIITVKRLEPFKVGRLTIKQTGIRAHDVIPFGAAFVEAGGNVCYIVFLLEGTRGISIRRVVHEFFHYLHYVKRGYKSAQSKEEAEKEEKEVRKQTRKFLNKLRAEWLN